MLRTGLLLFALGFMAGCDTYAAARYSISADSVMAQRQLGGQTVNVGTFTAAVPGQSEIVCRAVGPIKTPDGQPFSEYVRKALIDEIKIAGIFSENAPATITGRLNEAMFSSVAGTWTLALTLTSNNGQSITEVETFSFTSSFAAVTACREAANAFMPAVQNLVVRLVRNPGFRRLVTN